MNTWINAHPGGWLPPFRNGRFAIYRARFTPRAAGKESGGRLLLRDVVGKAQVWIDGKLSGEKSDDEKNDMMVAFPAGDGSRSVTVLVEASAPDLPAGLGGIVTVE